MTVYACGCMNVCLYMGMSAFVCPCISSFACVCTYITRHYYLRVIRQPTYMHIHSQSLLNNLRLNLSSSSFLLLITPFLLFSYAIPSFTKLLSLFPHPSFMLRDYIYSQHKLFCAWSSPPERRRGQKYEERKMIKGWEGGTIRSGVQVKISFRKD